MKILITGGAGFIGSALIRYLVAHSDHHVLNFDKLTYAGNLQSLAGVADSPRYQFVQGDICDAAMVAQTINTFQPDIIMHLAAETHVDRSIDGPADFITTNIIGTYTLLEAARMYWAGLPATRQANFRFHHISTDEVYGDLPHPDDCQQGDRPSGGFPSGDRQSGDCQLGMALPKFTEATAYQPSSPYSASKASSDHLVRAWQRTYGLPVVVSNCSNNYGPYQFPEKLIPLVILRALKGESIPVYGAGDQIRDWLYVDDHASALVCIAERGRNGETYNVGGLNEQRHLDVIYTICDVLEELRPSGDEQGQTSYRALIEHVSDRPGHDRRYAIDASKLTSELGWQPAETFHSGLRKTVQWYLDNQSWWQAVVDGSYRLERLGEYQ